MSGHAVQVRRDEKGGAEVGHVVDRVDPLLEGLQYHPNVVRFQCAFLTLPDLLADHSRRSLAQLLPFGGICVGRQLALQMSAIEEE